MEKGEVKKKKKRERKREIKQPIAGAVAIVVFYRIISKNGARVCLQFSQINARHESIASPAN